MDGGLRCTGRRGGCGGAGAAASTAFPCGHWRLQAEYARREGRLARKSVRVLAGAEGSRDAGAYRKG